MLNILIMGAGAVGCFVGGSLAAAKHNVTLLGRPALMDTISARGLTIRRPDRPPQTVFPQTATAVVIPPAPYDFIFLTVKTPATAPALEQLLPLARASSATQVVSLQNGIGSEEQIAAALGVEQTIAGTITIPIAVPEPGVIEVTRAKGGLGLAALVPGQPVNQLAGALTGAGLYTAVYADYRAMKWSKLMLNIVTNASSAILDEPPAQIIARPELFNLELDALAEAAAVMKAQGIRAVKLPGYPVHWLARLVAANWLPRSLRRAILRPFLVSGRGAKMPSLHIDLAAGRPTTEVGALNGAIVRAGQQYGIPTPVNQALTGILTGLVSGRFSRADYRSRPEKLLEAVYQPASIPPE